MGRDLSRAGRVQRARSPRIPSGNTVVVGADPTGQQIAGKLLEHPDSGLNLLGFVGSPPTRLKPPIEHVAYLGTIAEIAEIVRDRDVERVIVTGQVEEESGIELMYRLEPCDIQIDVVSRVSEVLGPTVGTYSIDDVTLLTVAPPHSSPVSMLAKRVMDVGIGAVILVVTAPLFAWITWRMRRDSPGSILLYEPRLGEGMREFKMLKFRTTAVDASSGGHLEYIKQVLDKRAVKPAGGLDDPDDGEELTPIGRWLVRTSLDELPQLINVLKGDMSLVGPRPCLPAEVADFLPYHFERFSVPAGLTGLWQVTTRGRRSSLLAEFDADIAYSRRRSLGLDLRLLARTPLSLIRNEPA